MAEAEDLTSEEEPTLPDVDTSKYQWDKLPGKIAWPYNSGGGGLMAYDEEVARRLAGFHTLPVRPLPVWDPDDRSTWKYFTDNAVRAAADRVADELLPRILPWEDDTTFLEGEKIDYFSVFELYSITITKLLGQPKFDMIVIRAESTGYAPLVIYKQQAGGPIPFNQPLPLRGPHRTINCQYDVTISLCNGFAAGWVLYYDPRPEEYDVLLSRQIVDGGTDFEDGTDSVAEIKFEVIHEAAQATLLFEFIPRGQGEGPRSIRILGGTIFATNGEKTNTERIVKQFDEMQSPVVAVTRTNDNDVLMLPVDRYVFGVPKGSSLLVTASDLMCEEQGACFQIKGALDFPVLERTSSRVQYFTTGDTEKSLLRLTVFWSYAV